MALEALIDEALESNDRSAREAAELGSKVHRLTPSDISDYRKRGMLRLNPDKIVALAVGLSVPPYVVARAALADRGIMFPTDTVSPETAIERDYSLPIKTRTMLLAMLQAARSS